MIADIFSRRRIWVLIANAVIVGALGLILMPLSWLEGAIKYGTIPFLGAVPIDPTLTSLIETSNFSQAFTQSQLAPIFTDIVQNHLL